MYLNDVHIMQYVLFGIIGAIIGQFMDWCSIRLPEYKKVFTKEIVTEYRKKFKPNFILISIVAVMYMLLVYKFGIAEDFMQNLTLIKFLILVPMLVSIFVIDYRHLIIPNRINLTMFEIGLVFTFIYGINSLNSAIDMLLGMLVGGGIFLIITLIGGLIAGKEAMGFGDVKLMGAMGLFFGFRNMIVIAILSFLIGAILSIVLLATKIKKTNEYIPFGPFIVIAAIVTILVPFELIVGVLLEIFTLGMYAG